MVGSEHTMCFAVTEQMAIIDGFLMMTFIVVGSVNACARIMGYE
jgi:hypothetical protein